MSLEMPKRVPLEQEPICGAEAVAQYDRGARLYMLPEYKYFVWKILRRGIRRGRVLDIGTGSGRLAIELAQAGGCDFHVTALDLSPDMLDCAGDNIGRAGLKERIELVLGTAAELPFADRSFDLVVSYASLHHWLHPVAVFKESLRVADTGGQVIVRDNRRVYGNPLWEAFIWAISRLMNERHRRNWPGAIRASYTLPEVKAIVAASELESWAVSTDFIKFDLCVEVKRYG